jgi:hypothetical protein
VQATSATIYPQKVNDAASLACSKKHRGMYVTEILLTGPTASACCTIHFKTCLQPRQHQSYLQQCFACRLGFAFAPRLICQQLQVYSCKCTVPRLRQCFCCKSSTESGNIKHTLSSASTAALALRS